MIYKEIQKFKQPWIWFGLIISGQLIMGFFGLGFYKQIIQGQRFGNNPMSDSGLIISFILILLLFILITLFFGLAKLTTVIDKNGIKYRFFPFHLKFQSINWDKIERFTVVTYHPIGDYGGWGIRYSKNGKAYNVAGDKGLHIQLKTGKTLLIGTQKDIELDNFLSKLKQV